MSLREGSQVVSNSTAKEVELGEAHEEGGEVGGGGEAGGEGGGGVGLGVKKKEDKRVIIGGTGEGLGVQGEVPGNLIYHPHHLNKLFTNNFHKVYNRKDEDKAITIFTLIK